MTSRYCYCPATTKKIGWKLTIADRFRRWKKERAKRKQIPDVYQIVGYRAY